MTNGKWILALALFFLLATTGLGACNAITANVPAAGGANRPASVKIGDLAPEIDLKTMTGETFTLSKLQGKIVLVNFWATWCGPCRAEFPAFVRKSEQYRAQGFIVVGVNTQDPNSDEGVLTFMRNSVVNFPIVRDPEDRLSRAYRITGLPTSFFIDRNGIVRDIVIGGPMTDEYLDKQIEKLK